MVVLRYTYKERYDNNNPVYTDVIQRFETQAEALMFLGRLCSYDSIRAAMMDDTWLDVNSIGQIMEGRHGRMHQY